MVFTVTGSGATLGTLAVGETLSVGNTDYTLKLTDDILSVTVSETGPAPEKTKWTYLMYLATDNDLDYSALFEQGTIYLHEAFIREIDGETCVFVAENDVLKKRVVKTGSRMNSYIELLGAPVLPTDRIAFPYDKNCREGSPVEDAKGGMYYGYGW